MRIIPASLAFIVALMSSAVAEDAVPALTLKGAIEIADLHHYIELPFDVPPDVDRLTIAFSQDGTGQHTVIDLGLFDPERFRGWSGGARSDFTLAATDATPGYLPGPIPKGRWRLLMGVPNIRAGVTTNFVAKIYFGRTPGSSFAAAPLRASPAWYRGDLHMHTAHSDGKCRSRAGVLVGCPAFLTLDAADRRGLDFIVVTDHNTISHYDALRELQPYFDRTLIIPGRELTTFEGHANVLGGLDFIDFRLDGDHVRSADRMIDAVHRAGALFSINHPSVPSGEACMGCGWTAKIEDAAKIDAVEVVNGGVLRATGNADGPGSGFAFWQALLDKGLHPTAVGGSDDHDASRPLSEPGSIGSPTTVVYAENLSEPAILAGVKAGHVFIDVQGSRNRLIELGIDGERAMMGDHVRIAPGTMLRVHVTGVAGGHVEIVHDGALRTGSLPKQLLSGDDTVAFVVEPDSGRHWLYVKIDDAGGKLALISNPIYLE